MEGREEGRREGAEGREGGGGEEENVTTSSRGFDVTINIH